MSNAMRKPARRPTVPSSSRDLATMRTAPIGGFALPRLHVEPRQVDGGLKVFDRPSGAHVLVYTPRYVGQFRAGHQAGRWYVRSLTHVGGSPQSVAFDTARAAVEAVARGGWTQRPERPAPPPSAPRLRVIWTDSDSNADPR